MTPKNDAKTLEDQGVQTRNLWALLLRVLIEGHVQGLGTAEYLERAWNSGMANSGDQREAL
jgi:hypothetical protein